MRMTLIFLLAGLAQWGVPATAQTLPGTQPGARRLFFFSPDVRSAGRPVMFGRPAPPTPGSFLRPKSLTNPVSQSFAVPALKLAPTTLKPQLTPSQDGWRFVKPKNQRLFFFRQ